MNEVVPHLPEVCEIADIRMAAHVGLDQGDVFGDPYEIECRGVAGELEFSREFKLPMDRTARPKGDGNWDFKVTFDGRPITIDVKTFKNPSKLLVKVSHANRLADLLVVAHWTPGDKVVFVGWEHSWLIPFMPKDTFGHVLDYYRPRDELRAMWKFRRLMQRRDQ